MLCNRILFTPERKKTIHKEYTVKKQKGDHLDTKYMYMIAQGSVPKINDLIIKSKQLISKQIIIRHQN